MKKLLIAAIAASVLMFGSQANVEASTSDNLNTQGVELQEMKSKWANFRDKYISDRDKRDENRSHQHYYDTTHDTTYRHGKAPRPPRGYGAPPSSNKAPSPIYGQQPQLPPGYGAKS